MQGKPFDWNVVVAGAWNVAILTPEGIARRLYELDPGTPVEVQVPLDRQAPIRVVHSNVMVVPSESRLVIAPVESTAGDLEKAAGIASKAIQSLPETPLSAVGVNLRYQFDAMPNELLEVMSSSLDDRLAEQDFRIVRKSLKRSVPWHQGVLNLEVIEAEDASGVLTFNFHRESAGVHELRWWLSQVASMVAMTRSLVLATFKTTIEEVGHE